MRQGEIAQKGAWTGSPTGGVTAPKAIILPDSVARFDRTSRRLAALAEGHPMEGWLGFMAEVAAAQSAAAGGLAAPPAPDPEIIRLTVEAGLPPLAADVFRPAPLWRDGLERILNRFDPALLPHEAAGVIAALRVRGVDETEALADAFLRGGVDPADAGEAFWVAAALQVAFTRLAATLPADGLRLPPQRGLCPACGSTPSAALVRASGGTPGARYLCCSLCSTAWHYSRAVCVTCGGSRTLTLRGIDGDAGLVKSETCDECQTYAKVLYEAKDMGVDPYADDLASLALDVLVSEAGWSRHAPNPLLLMGAP